MTGPDPAARPLLAATRKQRPSFELASELIFRPLAHPLVLGLLPLGVAPAAVVVAGTGVGLLAAVELARGELLLAAILLQLKTLLDNADGQLARASGRVTAFGRYLDSESDLLVNAALFAALAWQTGEALLAGVCFLLVTLVLSVDFNLELLYRRERGDAVTAQPATTGATVVLARIYGLVYAPQDRLVGWFCERRLRGASKEQRLAYHDRATLMVVANYGFSTQFLVLGICLALDRPAAYLWIVVACALSLVPLEWRRERRSRA